MVTRGVVSKLCNAEIARDSAKENVVVAIMTSAAVHQGNSGGALFDAHGNLLGMVTCNMGHVPLLPIPQSNGEFKRYPQLVHSRVSLSIPMSLLSPLIRACRGVEGVQNRKQRRRVFEAARPIISAEETVWGIISEDPKGNPFDVPGRKGPRSEKFNQVVQKSRQQQTPGRSML